MIVNGVIIANSQRDEDELVAELWVEDEQIAEVYFVGEQVFIEFLPRTSDKGKTLSYEEFLVLCQRIHKFVSTYVTETEFKKLLDDEG